MITILLLSIALLTSCLSSIFAKEENYDLNFAWKGPYSEGLAPVLINDKFGYVDANDQFAIEPKFLGASEFNQGLDN